MTLEKLYLHHSFPFSNFQKSDTEFVLMKMFWVELFRSSVSKKELQNWQVLFPAERDGNPILHMANLVTKHSLYIGIRTNEKNNPIYQPHDPFIDDEYIERYFLPFDLYLRQGFDQSGTIELSGLGISTEMSPKAIEMSKEVICLFCQNKNPEQKIEQMINSYYKELDDKGYHGGYE